MESYLRWWSSCQQGCRRLTTWNGYLESENTCKSALVVLYLQKLINIFHKEHSKKWTAIFASLYPVSPMIYVFGKPLTIGKTLNWQQRPLIKDANKKDRKLRAESFNLSYLFCFALLRSSIKYLRFSFCHFLIRFWRYFINKKKFFWFFSPIFLLSLRGFSWINL